jgi:hypothetical protein
MRIPNRFAPPLAFLLVGFWCATSPAFAARTAPGLVTVCVYHVAKGAPIAFLGSANDPASQRVGELSSASPPAVLLEPRESANIEFCDYNPVLFTYSIEDKPTDLPDVAAAKAFATALQTLVGTLGGQLKAGGQGLVVNGLNLKDFGKDLSDLSDHFSNIGKMAAITQSEDASKILAAQQEVATWAAQAQSVNSELVPKLSAIGLLLSMGQKLIITAPSRLPDREITPLRKSLEELRTVVSTGPNADPDLTTQVDALAAAVNQTAQLTQMAQTVTKFCDRFAKVWKEPSTATAISFDNAHSHKVSIKVTANADFAEYLTPATKQYQKSKEVTTGLALTVLPDQKWSLSIAPGAIYSFVTTYKYTANSTSSGGLAVAASRSNYAAVSGAVALNISRTDDIGKNFTPFYQVGIAPQSGKLGFFLGGGFTLYKDTVLSGGVIYQQRDVLGPGLSVGSPLAKTSDLVVNSEFKFGAYLGISVNVAGTGKDAKP